MALNFKVTSGKNKYLFSNDHSVIVLEQTGQGTLLKEIRAVSGENYLRRPTPLWLIEMTNRAKEHVQLDPAGIKPSVTDDGRQVLLAWEKVPIKGTKQSVTVQVILKPVAGRQIEWRLSVVSVPEEWSVWRVHFPRLDLAVEDSDDYTFIVPQDRGVAYKNPLKTIPTGPTGSAYEVEQLPFVPSRIRPRSYPHGGSTMQFLGLQHNEELFYFAAHDPVPHLKTFYFAPNQKDSLIHLHPYTDTVINYGGDYHSFLWITACTEGDWYDAAQIYRKFALTAPWTARGSLEQGHKTPRWYQNTPMVTLRLNRGPGYNIEDLIAEKEFFGVPIVCHYYMWHKSAFDAGNPFFFPTVPGFRQTIARLREKEIYLMPYVNPYSADTSLDEWEQGLKDCALQINENGEHALSVWSQGKAFAAMCPASALWRRLINLLAMRTFEMGLRALYFDEVGASPPWPCYNAAHKHELGGGAGYVRAWNRYFKEIRDEVSDFIDQPIMASESCAEPYMLYLDTCAIGNGNDPQAIPLFETVYHDYMMGFGRYVFTVELTDPQFQGAIISKHAQQFVWGCQFGWSNVPLIAIIRKDPVTANFLKELAHVWVNNSDYLARGKMLRPLDLSDQLKPVTRRWAHSHHGNKGTDVKLMPVLNSVWQIDDSSVAVVLVNITEEPINLKIKLPNEQHLILQQMKENKVIAQAAKPAASTRYYPLSQNALGVLRQQDGEKLVESICDGDSENGFNVKLDGLKCAVIIISNAKEYGVHE